MQAAHRCNKFAHGFWSLVTGSMAVWALAACAPALNWRETAVPGPGLTALFPCRPVGLTRPVQLAGRAITLTLQSCEAAGQTYAVATGEVSDPAAVAGTLRALHEATARNLGAGADTRPESWEMAGATPQADAGRWRLAGHRPDGQPLEADTAVFARGTWVVQATVIGSSLGEAMTQPFFEGLRFAP